MGHGLIGMKMEKNGMKEPIGRGEKLGNGLIGTKMDKKNMRNFSKMGKNYNFSGGFPYSTKLLG